MLLPIVTFCVVQAPESTPLPPADDTVIESAAMPVVDVEPVAVPVVAEKLPTTTAPVEIPEAPWSAVATEKLEAALPYLVLVWLLGVFGLSLWHLGGWAQLQRLKRCLVEPVADELRDRANALAVQLRIRQAVAIVRSALVQVPTVVGWIKPMILLPASALTGLSAGQLEALLAHELGHIRRHDYLVNMFQTAIEILGFYHPAVWWASRRIRAERENCCDDVAANLAGDCALYADALTTMEELRGGPRLAMAASGGSLFARIRRLAGKVQDRPAHSGWIPAALAVLLLAAATLPAILATQVSAGDNVNLKPSDDASKNVSAGASSAATSSAGQRDEKNTAPESREVWIQRLKSLRAHMAAAFGAGSELAGLGPDFGLAVVQTAWPELANDDVKTGVLKAFAFSKGLTAQHPHTVRVLHLGMTDDSEKVRKYAANYLASYAFEDFSTNPEAYRQWFRQHGEMSLEELHIATRPRMMQEGENLLKALAHKDRSKLWDIAGRIGNHGDPLAIPLLISLIEADNTYDTVYGIGYFGLGKLTGVPYDEKHDGTWWRRWWDEHRTEYPEDVRQMGVPDSRSVLAEMGAGNAAKEDKVAVIPAPLDMAKADEEVKGRYAAAHPEIQEYILWTARTFGRSAMWLNEDALAGLSDAKREEKVAYLAALFSDSEYGRHLCRGLAEASALKDERLVPGLMKVAGYQRESGNYDCRPKWIAVSALARQESDQAVPLLISLVDHGNQNTRKWARAALARKTGQDFKEDKPAWEKWWRDATGVPTSTTRIMLKTSPEASNRPADDFVWQKRGAYEAPDFDAFFPDNPKGGAALVSCISITLAICEKACHSERSGAESRNLRPIEG